MPGDKGDRSRKILAGRLCAGTINQCKGVVSHLGKFQRVGKAVVHRTNVGKTTAGVYDSELCAGISLKEEQTRISFRRICALFLFRINVIKDGVPVFRLISDVIADLRCLIGIYVVVPGKRQIAECATAIIAGVHRKN